MPPRLQPLASVSHAQFPLQEAEELTVLKAIVSRELSLDQLLQLVTSFDAAPVDVLACVLRVRDTSLAVVEAIATWRGFMVRPVPFLWHDVNYLHRMASDADFLSKSTVLHHVLGLKLKRRNPFCTVPGLDAGWMQVPRDDPAAGLSAKTDTNVGVRIHEASMYVLEEEHRMGGPYKPPCTDPRWAYMVQREAEHITQLRFGKAPTSTPS
ncbi:hypothetical protein H310_11061 [Aphanomyces invadans]|uniref:Uncharacterized protein n=1 Tax=Aphanomyces invadans TaxID=157072 RepID=A0A024TNQ3_9STRA|nr:hypothetical protein H310_11061 [Aphanomyces invadans]ETV95639.1 hypothetical protein H310_11061 [Aphanomyces invadans]|eukprot:XP_008875832.1 hypothetical protein H310_11061 [Aphanomyces invadans]